jgi:hypothetical protein
MFRFVISWIVIFFSNGVSFLRVEPWGGCYIRYMYDRVRFDVEIIIKCSFIYKKQKNSCVH